MGIDTPTGVTKLTRLKNGGGSILTQHFKSRGFRDTTLLSSRKRPRKIFPGYPPSSHADQPPGDKYPEGKRKEHPSWRCLRIPLMTADSTIPTPTLSSLSFKIFSLTSSPGYAGDAFWLHTICGHHLNQKHYMLRLGAVSEAKSNGCVGGAAASGLAFGRRSPIPKPGAGGVRAVFIHITIA